MYVGSYYILTNMHGRKHGLLEQNIKPMKFLCCVTPGPRGGRSHSFPKFIVTLIRKRRTRVPGVAIMSISNISNTLVMRSIVHLIYCSCSIFQPGHGYISYLSTLYQKLLNVDNCGYIFIKSSCFAVQMLKNNTTIQ